MAIVKNRDGTATIHPVPYPHRRTKLEIWYDVWPTDYSNPPGDPDRYDEPVPDMIGSISDSYPDMKSLLIGAGNSTERRIGGGEFTDLTVLDLPGADIINLLDAKEIVLHDLNVLPYPFEDDSFDEIHAYEVLEHCGAQGDVEFFFAQFNELHRILREGGHLCASVPLPGSVWAWADPGHRRVITVETLSFLQQEHYEQLGKTTCADYRPWIKGWWQIVWAEPHNDSLYFTLEAL